MNEGDVKPNVINQQIRELFLKVLSETGNQRKSAEACGFSVAAFKKHKAKDSEFSDAWDAAYQDSMDKLESEAWRRAYEGYEEPVFYQGRQVGIVRKYSDKLIEFLLTGGRPEKYAHKYRAEITGRDGKPLIPDAVGDIEIARRLTFILTQASAFHVKQEEPKEDTVH